MFLYLNDIAITVVFQNGCRLTHLERIVRLIDFNELVISPPYMYNQQDAKNMNSSGFGWFDFMFAVFP